MLFEEFKGTGNMELRLRRDLAEKRMFPAIDPVPSGTRRDDLLHDPAEHAAVISLRRALAALDPQHALELLLEKTTLPNSELLSQVRQTRYRYSGGMRRRRCPMRRSRVSGRRWT